MIASAVYPSAELHGVVDVLFAQVAATVAAHGISQLVTGDFPTARVSSGMAIERTLDNRGGLNLAADFDAKLLPHFGQVGRNVSEGNRFLECG